MPSSHGPHEPGTRPQHYAIRVRGHLDDRWASAFEGLALLREEGGTTLLAGPVADQAALYALLRRIRDLGLPLLSVTPITGEAGAAPGTHPS